LPCKRNLSGNGVRIDKLQQNIIIWNGLVPNRGAAPPLPRKARN
jgi:hypothetical protein